MFNVLMAMWLVMSRDESEVTPMPVSCAAASLFAWGRFSGIDLSLEQLCKALPDNSEGHNIEELIVAARKQGAYLEVQRVRASLPNRPFIVYLLPTRSKKPSMIGHFQTLRPLDSNSRQYQIIEPRAQPLVVEGSELLADHRFSKVVLVSVPLWRITFPYILISTGSFGIICLFVDGLLKFLRKRLTRFESSSDTNLALLSDGQCSRSISTVPGNFSEQKLYFIDSRLQPAAIAAILIERLHIHCN